MRVIPGAAAPFDLRNAVVLVTGATQGIGRELAFLLAEAGGVVVATGRSADALDGLRREAAERDVGLDCVLLDVRDTASIAAAVAEVVELHGGIDVLVNNAGLGHAHRALDVTEADFDEMMSVNLRGLFFMSQAAARVMIPRGGGRIINISSQGGVVGLPDAAVYCASKGGVNMLTKVLALEWAEHGINVNAIAPTFVHTPGTAPLLDGPGLRDEILARIPLRQLGTPADVAGAVVYLATAASRLVTGTVLMVDGGWTAQ
ncbi:MAG: short-chain dehydrogenase/reductase [Blastococcus sp.]|nr:short-chain dehydrogenase/reductase [Blastococcus sp.]